MSCVSLFPSYDRHVKSLLGAGVEISSVGASAAQIPHKLSFAHDCLASRYMSILTRPCSELIKRWVEGARWRFGALATRRSPSMEIRDAVRMDL